MQTKVYFTIVILSTLVIGGLFGAPAAKSGCPPQGEVQCFKDPCLGEECPAFPDAKCVPNYCGGCNFDWFNKLGQKVNCEITS